MDLGKRVRELMEKKNVTPYEVATRTGISQTSLSRILNNITSKLNIKNTDLLSEYFGVSRSYLLTGKDEKSLNEDDLGDDTALGKIDLVPLLPISAMGVSLRDFFAASPHTECERIISPVKDADLALMVTGEAMAPEYPNGSLILIKKIDEKAFIQWGSVFVLDTTNGVVFRKILPAQHEGNLRCISINPGMGFPPFEIKTEELFGIYKVLMCMILK